MVSTSRSSALSKRSNTSTSSSSSQAKKEKLKNLMIERILSLYSRNGDSKPTPEQLTFVAMEVEKIIRNGSGSEQDLVRIEKELRAMKRSNSSASTESKKNIQLPLINTGRSASSNALSVNSRDEGRNSTRSSSRSSIYSDYDTHRPTKKTVDVGKDVWAALTIKDVEKFNEEQYQQHIKEKELKVRLRKELDDQVKSISAVKKQEKDKEQMFTQKEQEELNKWKEEQKNSFMERQKKVQQERQARDMQLEEANRRKMEEEEERKREEQRVMNKLKREISKERERESQKRENHKKEIMQFLEYNEKMKNLKLKEHEQEIEQDRLLQEEYIKKQERQEQQRQAELKRMYDRQAKSIALGAQLFKTMDEKMKEDEERAQREQQEISQKKEMELKTKAEKAQMVKEQIKQTLAAQIKERENKQNQMLDAMRREKEALEMELLEAERTEQQKRMQKRQMAVANKRELEDQIVKNKSKQSEGYTMTEAEKKLNADLLRKINLGA